MFNSLQPQTKPQTEEPTDNRFKLAPFIKDESGIKALKSYIRDDNQISRGGMYLLNILTNLIKHNGTNIYQRTPPEVFGGLSENNRRNIQATLLCRASNGEMPQELRDIQLSGYTKEQEIIGKWAERDGCWSDTPESDHKAVKRIHDSAVDGSEAMVFYDADEGKFYKNIIAERYEDLFTFIDRINIHNATFPEAALTVEGFGQRETDDTNMGFEVIVSQRDCEGIRPTWDQIVKGMEERGYELATDGKHFVSIYDDIAITDVNEKNAVWSEKGKRLLVFDCEARLKTFNVEKKDIKSVNFESLLFGNKDRDESWKQLIGPEHKELSPETKSQILKSLRYTGRTTNPVNGDIIMMKDPEKIKVVIDGKEREAYSCNEVVYGPKRAFRNETLYKVPELNYSPENVSMIMRTIEDNLPKSMWLEAFFADKDLGGITAHRTNGTAARTDIIYQLQTRGKYEGLYNGMLISLDPEYPVSKKREDMRILVSTPEKVEFLLFGTKSILDDGTYLSKSEQAAIKEGKTVEKNDKKYYFNLDRGRIDSKPYMANKLAQKQGHKKSRRNTPA